MIAETEIFEFQALSAIVGEPIVAFERSAWGFENRTDIVTLADGRRLVVQRISNRSLAEQKLRLALLLPDRLAAVGIRLPRVLAADATADSAYAIREYLPGEPGAALMDSDTDAIQLATEMGALLRRLPLVSTENIRLHTAWSDSVRLEQQARRQLARCRALLGEATCRTMSTTIDEVADRFAGRAACFAHGDFSPVNALVEGGRVVALLDVEFARRADPLFDAAWWGWIVRYHHPERWAVAWPKLLDAAGIVADDATLGRIQSLQRLRCLEIVDYAVTYGPEIQVMWARRLNETISWSHG